MRAEQTTGRTAAMGLVLGVLLLGSAPAVWAQCNSDLTLVLSNNIGLIVGEVETVTLIVDNQSPQLAQEFETVFYRPNCEMVDASKDPDDPLSCDPLEDGFGGVQRPFNVTASSLRPETTCPGVVLTDFAVGGIPGPASIEFTFPSQPGGVLTLGPQSSCQIVFQLEVANFPEDFPADFIVRQIAGQAGSCVDSPLGSQSKDTAGTTFGLPFCGASVDKQVSCDGGLTWHDVDPNLGDEIPDGVAEGCIGWDDPNSPPEVRVRYFARNLSTNNFESGNDLTSCSLSDSNPAVLGAPIDIGTLVSGVDFSFETELLECNAALELNEPNTATLDCICPADVGQNIPIQRTDEADIECQAPALEVSKECTAELDPDTGDFIYTVTATNPANPSGATLNNCVLT
ncbi:MAG: hypothetical protein GY769_03920, partial [bacterium]|nr:hypothetical protein [bacterium]